MHDISLISAYWRHLDDHHFTADPAQEALIARLQQLLDALLSSDQSKYMAWDPRRYLPVRPAIGETKGLYVWGRRRTRQNLSAELVFSTSCR